MKKILITVLIVSLLMIGMVAPASAYFTDTEKVKITGKTGSVDIYCTYKVNLPQDMQPGHTYWVQVKIKENGACPVRLQANVINKPWFLNVSVSPAIIPRLSPGGTAVFKIKVVMPPGVGNSEMNKSVALYIQFYAQNL